MTDRKPKWQKELESFKGIKSTFIIEGNINDLYPFYENGKIVNYIELDWLLMKTFKDFFENENEEKIKYDFVFCNPVLGFYNRSIKDNVADILKKYDNSKNSIFSSRENLNYKINDIEKFSEIVKNVVMAKGENPVAVVVNFAARYISSPNSLETSENNMFINLLEASIRARMTNGYVNTLILVVEKFNDLPSWFYYNNPNVRTITIPNPDKNMRKNYIEKIYENELKEEFETKDKFIDNTEGLKNRELKELKNLFNRYKKIDSEYSLLDALTMYKYGIKENMWESISEEKVKNLEEITKAADGIVLVPDEGADLADEKKLLDTLHRVKKLGKPVLIAYAKTTYGAGYSELVEKQLGALCNEGVDGVMMETFVVLFILNIGNFLNTGYEQYLLFKNSLTAPNIEVLDLYTYRIGLQNMDYSYGVAISVVKSIVSITLVLVANMVAKKIRGKAVI